MSNNNRSAAFHRAVKSLLHNLLTMFVKGGGCFIQDDQLRISDQGAGDGDTLFLPTRKLASFKTAPAIKAFRKLKFSIFIFHRLNKIVLELLEPCSHFSRVVHFNSLIRSSFSRLTNRFITNDQIVPA